MLVIITDLNFNCIHKYVLEISFTVFALFISRGNYGNWGRYYFIVKNICEYRWIHFVTQKSNIFYTHISILKYFYINKAHKSKYIVIILYKVSNRFQLTIICYPV